MAFLRYILLLFASSMVVKIPLMALFHFGHLVLTGKGRFETLADVIANLQYTELVLFIPLYLIYLPLFIFNVKTLRVQMRYLRTDMAMIGGICALLALVIGYLNTGLWMGIVLSVFCLVYFILTAEVHARLTLPDIWGQEGGPPPKDMDTTLPEYKEWQERWEARLRVEQEARIARNSPAEEKKAARKRKQAERSLKTKIERVFFYTGVISALISGAIIATSIVIGFFVFLCAVTPDPKCLDPIMWSVFKPSLENIFIFILLTVLVPMGLYATLLFSLYGPIIKHLWYKNLRTYAHFGLAANVPILAYIIGTQGFTAKNFDPEIGIISFYIFSYTAIITSAIHLNLLKRYHRVFGIPDAPPRKKRWYDRFLGIKTAEAEV